MAETSKAAQVAALRIRRATEREEQTKAQRLDAARDAVTKVKAKPRKPKKRKAAKR